MIVSFWTIQAYSNLSMISTAHTQCLALTKSRWLLRLAVIQTDNGMKLVMLSHSQHLWRWWATPMISSF